MRHFLERVLAVPLAVGPLPVGVAQSSQPARLVAPSRPAHHLAPRTGRATRRAVAIAPVTSPAEEELPSTPRTGPWEQIVHAPASATGLDRVGRGVRLRKSGGPTAYSGRPTGRPGMPLILGRHFPQALAAAPSMPGGPGSQAPRAPRRAPRSPCAKARALRWALPPSTATASVNHRGALITAAPLCHTPKTESSTSAVP
jgi:hypothetical protein